MKFLRSELDCKVTHNEKLASWTKARQLGVCPPFKLVERDLFEDFLDKDSEKVEQHCIVVEAGVTLQELLD